MRTLNDITEQIDRLRLRHLRKERYHLYMIEYLNQVCVIGVVAFVALLVAPYFTPDSWQSAVESLKTTSGFYLLPHLAANAHYRDKLSKLYRAQEARMLRLRNGIDHAQET